MADSSPGYFVSSFLTRPNGTAYTQDVELLRQQFVELLAVTAVFLPLAWFVVGLRIYVRAYMTKTFGADDWAMIFTTVCFTLYSVAICVFAVHFGRSVVPLAAGLTPKSDAFEFLVTWGWCMYSLTMIALKVALGLFFLRIFIFRRGYQIAIWILMAGPALLGLAAIIFTFVEPCQIETEFFIGLPRCGMTSPFYQNSVWLRIAEAWTLANTASDILMAGVAVMVIVQMQLARRNKISAALLCALGSIGCVASCVRLVFLVVNIHNYSYLGQSILEAIWSSIEPGLGIIAASLATLRPLARAVFGTSHSEQSSAISNPNMMTTTNTHLQTSQALTVPKGIKFMTTKFMTTLSVAEEGRTGEPELRHHTLTMDV